jgi:hypothetical protein
MRRRVLVHVALNPRGGWEVALPDRRRIACKTLEEARRVAYVLAAKRRPCELLVHDAYHRVVHHELVDGEHMVTNGDTAAALERGPLESAKALPPE